MTKNFIKIFYTILSISFLISFIFTGFVSYDLFYKSMTNDTSELSIIKIDKNSTAASFVHTLKDRNFIKYNKIFLFLLRAQNYSQQLKAGIYQIHPGESAQQFLTRVVAGDVLKEEFRIIAGTTINQVSNNLSKAKYLSYDRAKDWYEIEKGLPNAEGLLLADTYQYNAGGNGKALLTQAYSNLMEYLNFAWLHRDMNLPYTTPYELLIAASIIEKETSVPQEKKLISGVIVNRIRKNMPLQMDPTVIYALGLHYDGKLNKNNLKFDSPYNTYRHRGLPPTPIAIVGKDAIDAAAHPQITDYLYFVAKGDGTHEFSVTYDQQKLAIARYKKVKM